MKKLIAKEATEIGNDIGINWNEVNIEELEKKAGEYWKSKRPS